MNKMNTRLRAISLMVISVIAVVLAVSNMVEIELPDAAVRIMGVLDICAILVFVYTSIMNIMKKN